MAAKEVAAKEVAMVIVRTARTEETARRGRGEGAAQITQRRTQGASQIGRIAPRFMAYGGPGQSARLTVTGVVPQHCNKMARRRDMRGEDKAMHSRSTHT